MEYKPFLWANQPMTDVEYAARAAANIEAWARITGLPIEYADPDYDGSMTADMAEKAQEAREDIETVDSKGKWCGKPVNMFCSEVVCCRDIE